MTADDVIKDLNDRLDRGITELEARLMRPAGTAAMDRIGGKIEGLKLVKDWLRSYGTGLKAPEDIIWPSP